MNSGRQSTFPLAGFAGEGAAVHETVAAGAAADEC